MADLVWPKLRKLLRAPNVGFNAEVYRYFKDVVDTDPNTSVTRKAVRDYCLIGAKDSKTAADAKIRYFREQVQRVHFKPDLYGIPVTRYHEEVAFHPQIELFFAQDSQAVSPGKTTVTAEINIRVMGETEASINETKAKTLAIAIKNEFVIGGNGYTFTKGKYIVSYVDKRLSYYLQIYASSETEGENVVKKILSIQNHTYDSNKLTLHSPKKNTINNPTGTRTVYGKQVDNERWRPTANVQFRYATLKLSGLDRNVILVDTTGYFRDALVKA